MFFDRSKERNKSRGVLTVSPCSFETPRAPVAWGRERNTQKAAAPEGGSSPQGDGRRGELMDRPVPESSHKCAWLGRTPRKRKRGPGRLGFQPWDLCLSFAFLMKYQFQSPPHNFSLQHRKFSQLS